MADANQELFDASLRHQIGIRRFTAGEVKQILAILEAADRDLTALLRRRLPPIAGEPGAWTTRRYQELLTDIQQMRRQLMTEVRNKTFADMRDLARLEQDFEMRIFQNSLPVQLNMATASTEQLLALVTSVPFAGGPNAARTLDQWFTSLAAADQVRLRDALNIGLTNQETVDQMVRRVAGTKKMGFRDGILAVTRRNAEAIVRTAANHVSNAAREQFWQANDDIIMALKWNATLDGRTSRICMARDGHYAPASGKSFKGIPTPHLKPASARPPAHPNCRSVMIAVLDEEGVANAMGVRPFVRDTRTRRFRERDFRADARARIGEKRWSQMSRSQRNALIKNEREAWTKANVGQVPADVDYDTWLRRQPAAFQDDVLGPGRAAAFRKGLKLDKFVDRAGNELTLDELKDLLPDFF